MTRHLTTTVARDLAGHSGQPVTSEVRRAERVLSTGGVALLLLTPSTEWDTYEDGTAAFTLVLAAGPVDHEDKAQDKLDAALLPILDGLADMGVGADTVAPSAYAASRGDSQLWPAYKIQFTYQINITDLKE